TIPTMSFSIAEEELRGMGVAEAAGNYAAWNYFENIDSDQNRNFVREFKKKYGSNRVTDDPMEAAYFGVYLWAHAVEDAGTDEVNAVRESVKDESWNAPEGVVYVDAETRHTWKIVRIGK